MTGLLLTHNYIAMMERLEEIKAAIPKSVHSDPVQIDDEGYLWEITYESFDKKSADFHFAPISFGCSGVQKGKLRGRNFDWFYGFDTTWVVHTKKGGERTREVTGIAFLGGVTNRMMIDGYRGEGLEYLPYRMVDGINDMGLMIQTNVAPPNEAWGRTTGTNPGKPLLFALEFCQYALERCSTVAEVMAMLDNVNFIAAYGKLTEEFHYLVRDRQGVEGVIEFVGNAPVFVEGTEDEPPVMTNFNIAEYRKGNYGLHPAGLERYAILKDRYSGIGTASDMMETMRAVRYTLSFEGEPTDEGAWLSESLGNWGQHGGELNWENTNHLENKEMFVEPYRYMKWLIANDPVGKTWWTVHTSVYDMENGVMSVALHENYDKIYTFDIPKDESVALPPRTIRAKTTRAATEEDFPNNTKFTIVDSENFIYDVEFDFTNWTEVLCANDILLEVLDANCEGVTNTTSMFAESTNLTTVHLFNTSNVTDMSYMFAFAVSLTAIPPLDTSNVTNVYSICSECTKVESGALALYKQLITQEITPDSYEEAFTNCGVDTATGLAELQQIPASWGGLAE